MLALTAMTLLVRDHDEAIAFYAGVLGGELVEDTDQGGGKRRVVVRLPGGGSTLVLARAVTYEQRARLGDQTGGRVFLFVTTDDFARDHAAFAARGVRFLEAPRHEPFGTVAIFVDPYGNKLDLVERRAPLEVAELDALVTAFRAATLPRARWTHAAHLAVGTWHALELPADAALAAMRTAIVRLNESHGTANTDTGGYHETVTRFYLTVLARFAAAHRGLSRAEIVRALLAGPLADRGYPLRFYTRDHLMSVAARRAWVEPDLQPL
jgi:catechol 2,3-dioxygenase-like lactoylglutathione lyase family enzyme